MMTGDGVHHLPPCHPTTSAGRHFLTNPGPVATCNHRQRGSVARHRTGPGPSAAWCMGCVWVKTGGPARSGLPTGAQSCYPRLKKTPLPRIADFGGIGCLGGNGGRILLGEQRERRRMLGAGERKTPHLIGVGERTYSRWRV
jgi:hypothetical protein